jgi:hypothetical protein
MHAQVGDVREVSLGDREAAFKAREEVLVAGAPTAAAAAAAAGPVGAERFMPAQRGTVRRCMASGRRGLRRDRSACMA